MRAGLLTENVDIMRPTTVRTVYGDEHVDYYVEYQTRARVENMTSQRTEENSEVLYNFQKRFTLRVYVPVQEFDRIRWKGKYYRIVSLEKDEREMRITVIGELVND